MSDKIETAVFGGGCFWCLEAVFLQLKGIIVVESGYSGGFTDKPTYSEVCDGKTGHAEVVKINFDPLIISYEDLLEIFFYIHDPTTLNRQGNDIGKQYRSIIFYTNDKQLESAKNYISYLDNSKIFSKKITTQIMPLNTFQKAEDYHQNYFAENQNQPYCNIVISPKIKKFKEKFGNLLK
ncbi:MAG: peptide-methionine (S)-S-oxide reductase MsrA [Candidatus Humimicrobiaceae bacterium]